MHTGIFQLVALVHSLAPGRLQHSITRLSRPVFLQTHTCTHNPLRPGRWSCHPCQSGVTHAHAHKHTHSLLRTHTNNGEGGDRLFQLPLLVTAGLASVAPTINPSSLFLFAWGPPLGPTCYSYMRLIRIGCK